MNQSLKNYSIKSLERFSLQLSFTNSILSGCQQHVAASSKLPASSPKALHVNVGFVSHQLLDTGSICLRAEMKQVRVCEVPGEEFTSRPVIDAHLHSEFMSLGAIPSL